MSTLKQSFKPLKNIDMDMDKKCPMLKIDLIQELSVSDVTMCEIYIRTDETYCTQRFKASLNSPRYFCKQVFREPEHVQFLGSARCHRDSIPPSRALGATDRRLVLVRWWTSTLPTSSLPGPGCRIRTLVTAARPSLVGSTVIARSLKSGGGSGKSRPREQSPSRT